MKNWYYLKKIRIPKEKLERSEENENEIYKEFKKKITEKTDTKGRWRSNIGIRGIPEGRK